MITRGGVLSTTHSLQTALDAASAAGGGEVVVPRGRHVVGTLRLASNTTLVLSDGAVLAGSTDLDHYPQIHPELRSYADNYTSRSIIYCERAHHVSVVGRGTIDGSGAAFLGRPYHERPYALRMIECEDVVVRDVTMRDGAMWMQHYLACRRVIVDGVYVQSRTNVNNDGIDIDSCTDFRLSNSTFDTEDDAVVLKATAPVSCRNVVVTNCVMTTDCNGFKIGTETVGSFSDIVVSNCSMYDVGLAAIAIESVDGAAVERVIISGLTARRAGAAIFVRLGHRGRPYDAVGTADFYDHDSAGPKVPIGAVVGITIANMHVSGCGPIGSSITGAPGAPVHDITLANVRCSAVGREGDPPASPEEGLDRYPEHRMFGPLPAHGLYARHVTDLHLESVVFTTLAPDQRPPLFFEDVDTTNGPHWSEIQKGSST